MKNEPMNQKQIEEIRAKERAATPGPWWHTPPVATIEQRIIDYDGTGMVRTKIGTIDCPEDAQFVAHARQDVPALLDEIDRLRGLLDSAVQDICGACEALVRASGHGWEDGCGGCKWDTPCTEAKKRHGLEESKDG